MGTPSMPPAWYATDAAMYSCRACTISSNTWTRSRMLARRAWPKAISGRVVALLVQPGTRVARGEPLLILEAMKMEHTLGAPADGICEAFNVAVGEQVAEGTELVQFTPSLPAPA